MIHFEELIQFETFEEFLEFFNSHKINGPINYENIRIDLIKNMFKIGGKVFFKEKFEIKEIKNKSQGWTREGVLTMMNLILKDEKLAEIEDIKDFKKDSLDIKKIMIQLAPIIISILPDNSIDLNDGNHRLALVELFLKEKNISAYILK